MYAWKSLSWSNLSFRVSDIAFLHMSTRLMVGSYKISSCVIWVRYGGGGVDTKSTMFSTIEVFVLFTFFRPTLLCSCFDKSFELHLDQNFVRYDIFYDVNGGS